MVPNAEASRSTSPWRPRGRTLWVMGDVTYKVIVEYATKGSLKAELPVLTGNAAALSSALRGGRHEASALGEALRGGLRSASEAFTGTIERAGALVRTLGAATLGAGIGAAITASAT